MLLLVDLDNTLIDRAAAFNAWSTDFVHLLGQPVSEAAWLIGADRDGYEARDSLARAVKERYSLDASVEDLVERLLFEHVDSMNIELATMQALTNARADGWRIAVVTNGSTSQQTLKIQTVGLEPYVDAVVISESVGVKKPDTEIFRIAARQLGLGLTGGWMVGDHPVADIAGGQAAGLETGWVSRGKEWPVEIPLPTLASETAAEIINAIVRQNVKVS
ncbi:HAD family hydrolase [Arthrobacter sp. TWP1-1]|uniref:HAD family hydrolase n=1 Tax=Arthrobacter sp. TWP1-1 TaxID=2804568 RepID=UPI003CF139BD